MITKNLLYFNKTILRAKYIFKNIVYPQNWNLPLSFVLRLLWSDCADLRKRKKINEAFSMQKRAFAKYEEAFFESNITPSLGTIELQMKSTGI